MKFLSLKYSETSQKETYYFRNILNINFHKIVDIDFIGNYRFWSLIIILRIVRYWSWELILIGEICMGEIYKVISYNL